MHTLYRHHPDLEQIRSNGGGGIRTPVPRCFKSSFYMLSRFIAFSLCQAPNDRLLASAISERSHLTGPNNRLGQPAV